MDVILKRFENPDEVVHFEKGKGCATAAFADGTVTEMKAGDLFYVPPDPHDSWVVGDEPYVSLHFLGAGQYAK
jgi:uncharacterized cupin superfamily protein